MNTSHNTSAISKQHMVRNEHGQFTKALGATMVQISQANADANVSLWRWLSQHGIANVEPSEVFASSGGTQ